MTASAKVIDRVVSTCRERIGEPRRLTLPPDSLMVVVVRVGVTVGAIAVAVGAVGRNGDRHDRNMPGMRMESDKSEWGPLKGIYTQQTWLKQGSATARMPSLTDVDPPGPAYCRTSAKQPHR
jgi:hypothetical protein